MTVKQVKEDLINNGGTILYEVQSFFEVLLGKDGILTLFYSSDGLGKVPDPKKVIPKGY